MYGAADGAADGKREGRNPDAARSTSHKHTTGASHTTPIGHDVQSSRAMSSGSTSLHAGAGESYGDVGVVVPVEQERPPVNIREPCFSGPRVEPA